jgi:ketosteroid isomerase-like protein
MLALASVAVAACSNGPVARAPAPPVDWASFRHASPRAEPASAPTTEERDVADAYLATLMMPHFAQLASRLANDVRVSFSGSEGVSGRERAVRLHEILFGAFDDRRFVADRVLCTADTQAVEWTMTGRQARDWMRVAPTGRSVEFNGVTVLWTKNDGTIAEAHVYFDVAAVKGQLGTGPKELELPFPPQAATGERLEQVGTPVEMANVGVVRAQLDALEAKDEQAYLASMTDDVEIHTSERAAGPTRGKQAAKAYYRTLDHAIAQLDTTVRNAWGITTFVVVEYSIDGLQLAPLGSVPLMPDRVVGLHVVDVDEISGGRIERIWRYDNPEEITEEGPDFEGFEADR